MLYNYIKTHYKQAEPIFLSDLLRMNITEPVKGYGRKRMEGDEIRDGTQFRYGRL